jgi:hypothetical protein
MPAALWRDTGIRTPWTWEVHDEQRDIFGGVYGDRLPVLAGQPVAPAVAVGAVGSRLTNLSSTTTGLWRYLMSSTVFILAFAIVTITAYIANRMHSTNVVRNENKLM